MPTNTYVALRKETIAVATNSVTLSLSGITGYTDLVLVVNARGSATLYLNDNLLMNFNGDTTGNYSLTRMTGNATSATSARSTSNGNAYVGQIPNSTSGSSIYDRSSNIIHIMDYANATTFKTILSRSSAIATSSTSTNSVEAYVNLWKKAPEAITSITLGVDSGNFVVGSTFSLYGIRAEGISPAPKATGGTIYSDSTYYYHAFGASGTFTPTQSITADVLVVAGGGGACNYTGGGAGGLLGFSSQSLTATGYTVTVGAGGASTHGGANNPAGTTGGDSQFGALTLVKGGGGGGIAASIGSNGISGASGGGGAPSYGGWGFSAGTQVPQGGTATPAGQGFAGGNGSSYQAGPDGIAGGGGGGAGGVGGAGIIGTGGGGGIGSITYSSWGVATGIGQNSNGTYYLAGGGAGYSNGGAAGAGGLGGGGASGVGGRVNTGGGAGGTTSSAGGSGVVIVRYAKV